MSSTVPIVGYYDVRGLVQPIRTLLKYAGVPFTDKKYPFGPGNTMAELDSIIKYFLADKYNLGLDFPNCPYYIEGDLKLTQSLTILRYLAKKHGLMAKTDPELARQEMVEQQLVDMRSGLAYMVMFPDFNEKKHVYINDTLIPQLELLSIFLGSNKWLMTSKISYIDILAYDILDWFRLLTPETFEKFPNLGEYMTRFESLKPIKEYFNSSEYKKWPLFRPLCQWGSKK